MKSLIERAIMREPITDEHIANELYEICDRNHPYGCSIECPVYKINGKTPLVKKGAKTQCKCFMDGVKMMDFIYDKLSY